jgi:transposase
MNRRLIMRYTREQRLDIGRQIYDNEITKAQAVELYKISDQTARDYMRLYRDVNHLPPKQKQPAANKSSTVRRPCPEPHNLEDYKTMSKEELIQELIKARIAEARLKKGYEVKGDGSIIQYSSRNTR